MSQSTAQEIIEAIDILIELLCIVPCAERMEQHNAHLALHAFMEESEQRLRELRDYVGSHVAYGEQDENFVYP